MEDYQIMKLKKSNFILIVHGEPNSVFLEIFFKALKKKKFKKKSSNHIIC